MFRMPHNGRYSFPRRLAFPSTQAGTCGVQLTHPICRWRSGHAASPRVTVTSTSGGAPTDAAAAAEVAGGVEAGSAPLQRRRRRGKLQPRPLAPGVAEFLAARGVDPEQLSAALPLRAPQLTLTQVQATWQVLERDYDIAEADVAHLLRRVPTYLGVDIEGDLRPKLEALGVRGEPLARLLGLQALVYIKLASLRPLLARLEHYVGAAAAAGLLPPGANLRALMAARPGSWAEAVACSAGRAEATFAVLHNRAGMDDAQLGAAVAGFPAVLKYSQTGIMAKVDVLARVLGGTREASALIGAAPAVLLWSPATAEANAAYLRRQLGWSGAQVAELVRNYWRTFGTPLTSPGLQRVLQLCEVVLGLSPSAMLFQHASSLGCAPEAAVVRLEFVAARGLQYTLRSPRLLKDTPVEWARRLQRWGVAPQEWAAFEAAYWAGPEGQALRRVVEAAARSKPASAAARESPAGNGPRQRRLRLACAAAAGPTGRQHATEP